MAGMRKVDTLHIRGKAKFTRLHSPDPMNNDFNVSLYLNPESYNIVMALKNEGLKNRIQKDEDGYYVRFRRPLEKDFNGLKKTFGPPSIVDTEGNFLDVLIGQGSDIVVVLEVYQHKTPSGGYAKAARLESVIVENLVPVIRAEQDNQAPQLW